MKSTLNIWSIGAVIYHVLELFCTGYKGSKTTHKYLALSSFDLHGYGSIYGS